MMDLFTETDVNLLIRHIRSNYDRSKPLLLVVDLFCGCGGTTTGFSKIPNTFVVACVNHDPFAIKSHHENHPYCLHYTEDIRDWAVIRKIESLIRQLRSTFPKAFVLLHASLECTHISRAKGGVPREADSRTLSFHLEKYLDINPEYISIENVEEILTNGPLDEQGRIIEELKGLDYKLWVEIIERYGYCYDYKFLNAADFGEYTSRKRYFGAFAKEGLPIEFPKPTHVSRKKSHLFPELEIHKPVKEVLNLKNEGNSIFGLNKNGKKYVDPTVTRVTQGAKKSLKEYNMLNVDGKVMHLFLSAYYGASQNGQGISSIEEPCNTLTTKDRFALHHIQYAYGKPTYSSIEEPAGTIVTNPKHELVTMNWLFDTQYNRISNSVEKPCPTIIARQDKKPLYLASATNTPFVDNSIENKQDSKAVKELKVFMRENGITDIKIRALEIDELLRIQGFPEDYILHGGKTRAKKYIGNSVVPGVAEHFGKTIYRAYTKVVEKVT